MRQRNRNAGLLGNDQRANPVEPVAHDNAQRGIEDLGAAIDRVVLLAFSH